MLWYDSDSFIGVHSSKGTFAGQIIIVSLVVFIIVTIIRNILSLFFRFSSFLSLDEHMVATTTNAVIERPLPIPDLPPRESKWNGRTLDQIEQASHTLYEARRGRGEGMDYY